MTAKDTTAQAHQELHKTLQQLSYNLNYPARLDNALQRAKGRLQTARKRRPEVFFAAAAGLTVVAGLTVTAVVSGLLKSRS